MVQTISYQAVDAGDGELEVATEAKQRQNLDASGLCIRRPITREHWPTAAGGKSSNYLLLMETWKLLSV